MDPALAFRSDPLSVLKPEIRVVHVCAPEIIETDPANFRELVQRLTGKPAKKSHDAAGRRSRKKRRKRAEAGVAETARISDGPSSFASGLGDGGDEFFRGFSGDLPLLPLLSFSGGETDGEAPASFGEEAREV